MEAHEDFGHVAHQVVEPPVHAGQHVDGLCAVLEAQAEGGMLGVAEDSHVGRDHHAQIVQLPDVLVLGRDERPGGLLHVAALFGLETVVQELGHEVLASLDCAVLLLAPVVQRQRAGVLASLALQLVADVLAEALERLVFGADRVCLQVKLVDEHGRADAVHDKAACLVGERRRQQLLHRAGGGHDVDVFTGDRVQHRFGDGNAWQHMVAGAQNSGRAGLDKPVLWRVVQVGVRVQPAVSADNRLRLRHGQRRPRLVPPLLLFIVAALRRLQQLVQPHLRQHPQSTGSKQTHNHNAACFFG
eukprot:m.138018 g.138018  ORF g.138018 m.138018 type:complete len:301 (-) comp16621_c0_seq1:171-1073(-)